MTPQRDKWGYSFLKVAVDARQNLQAEVNRPVDARQRPFPVFALRKSLARVHMYNGGNTSVEGTFVRKNTNKFAFGLFCRDSAEEKWAVLCIRCSKIWHFPRFFVPLCGETLNDRKMANAATIRFTGEYKVFTKRGKMPHDTSKKTVEMLNKKLS